MCRPTGSSQAKRAQTVRVDTVNPSTAEATEQLYNMMVNVVEGGGKLPPCLLP
jgi:hypothetical protein